MKRREAEGLKCAHPGLPGWSKSGASKRRHGLGGLRPRPAREPQSGTHTVWRAGQGADSKP